MHPIYKSAIVILLLVMYGVNAKAAATLSINLDQSEIEMINRKLFIEDSNVQITIADTVETKVKFRKGKAILFTIFTGFLGGHRIYLGTHQRTPILYSITLGGLGILPLIDLGYIIFTKDISVFENKTEIIMWSK